MSTATDSIGKARAAGSARAAVTDEQLLLCYRDHGDADVFARLVRRYEHELYNYLRRFLGDATLAEDVFQGTFLQLHLKCEQFEPGRKVRPWLYAIATNQAIDAQRRNKRHRHVSLDRTGSSNDDDMGKLVDLLVGAEPRPDVVADAEEGKRWLTRVLAELPEHLRTVVELVYFQGLKYREAAEVLSIPVGTVKSRLHTAILKLNEAWNETHSPEAN